MDMIKVILNANLCQINKQQNRNNRPYLNWQFITSHPYLCIGMIIAYLLTAILIYYTPYFGLYWTIGFTLFFLLLAAALLFDIKPTYRFKDIGILDLRVCYNGEWFVTEEVSDAAINKILTEPTINDAIKTELKRLIKQKSKITFYDIYLLAYSPNSIKNHS
ncbi:MAG TPA: YlaC family protein [Arsenophonus nasoniae]|uniref:YlaC family protein n=1 Tax=Arsenophonus nasoniae TaxID=638 RepID=UPI00387987EA